MDTIRSLTGVLVLFVFATLAACGGGGGGGGGEPIRSSDATLIGLSISAGTLTPGFSTTTLVYSVAVNNATGSVTVTPSATSATATIRVNSVVTASGSPSAAIALAVGTNVINIVVTAEDGGAATAYTITVTRQIPPRSDANLSNLTVSSGTLAPPFSPATIAYTNLVPMASDSINVVATVADANALMTINGATVSSGVLTAVPVPVGQSTITIVVAAQDATTKNYTIAVTRPGITLTPADSNITALSSAMLTVTLAAVSGGDTSVTLVSSNPAAVTVPNNVTVLAGLTQATFSATSISSEGTQATVTATLGVDSPTATVTVTGVDPPVAFRINDLDLRDPHFFVSFLGCRDVTDTPLAGFSFNGELQTGLQTDGNADGLLDYSPTILFRAFDQDGGTQPVEFYDNPNCTSPLLGTTCSRTGTADITTIATRRAIGQCLSPLAGTTRPYSPAITSPSGPCFVTNPASLTIDIAGVPLTLSSARIGATWVDSPAGSMTNGLISGFVSVTQANSTILPSTLPLMGGQPLSQLLPGGANNCAAHSDRDVANAVQGWWFYWNFTATKVNWVDN